MKVFFKISLICFSLIYSSAAMSNNIDDGFKFLKNKQYKKAILVFKPLASKGNVLAQYQFGEMLRKGQGTHKNYRFAMAYFKKAAKQGHADSSYMVGEMYEKGSGVEVDIKKAIFWWRKAAFKGSADAQINLSKMYFNGKGVKQDFIQSYAWSAVASAQKFPLGTSNRNKVASLMTSKEIEEGKKLAEIYWNKGVKPFQTGAYFTRPKLNFK